MSVAGQRRFTGSRSGSRITARIFFLGLAGGAAAVLAVFIAGRIGGLLAERNLARQQSLEKAAIERCLQSQDDEFDSLEQRRFARMACNKMRNDYRQRYGESL